jgi:hypothetical protein
LNKIERHGRKPELELPINSKALQPLLFGTGLTVKPGRIKSLPAHNAEIVQTIGESQFASRYVAMPSDAIIMALSMCAAHVEVATNQRDIARYWLEVWNDASRDYQMLLRKGRNLCGL